MQVEKDQHYSILSYPFLHKQEQQQKITCAAVFERVHKFLRGKEKEKDPWVGLVQQEREIDTELSLVKIAEKLKMLPYYKILTLNLDE